MSLLVSSLYDLQTQKFLLENEGKTRGGGGVLPPLSLGGYCRLTLRHIFIDICCNMTIDYFMIMSLMTHYKACFKAKYNTFS